MEPEGIASERLIWSSYPSWRQFSWLYLITMLVTARGLLFLRLGIPGGEVWLIGAGTLLVCVAILRHWARYELTSSRVAIRNGYTGRTIGEVNLPGISEVEVWQGPVASLLGIGTVLIKAGKERLLRLRGIVDPETVKARIEAVRPARADSRCPRVAGGGDDGSMAPGTVGGRP